MKIKEIKEFKKLPLDLQELKLKTLKNILSKHRICLGMALPLSGFSTFAFLDNLIKNGKVSYIAAIIALASLGYDIYGSYKINQSFRDVVEAETIMTLNEINTEEDMTRTR